MSIEKIVDEIYMIDTGAWGIKRAISVYLLRGKFSAILDSGLSTTVQNVVTSLKHVGVDPKEIRFIFVSHRHFDHAGGASPLLHFFPNAVIGIHNYSVKHLLDPSGINKGARDVFCRYFAPLEPVKDESRIIGLKGGENISLGGDVEIEAIYAPGHTSDSIVFYEKKHGFLFAGDSAGIYNRFKNKFVPTAFPPSFKSRLYIESIKRFMELNLKILAFAHQGYLQGKNMKDMLMKSIESVETWEKEIKDLSTANKDIKTIREAIMKRHSEVLDIFPREIQKKIFDSFINAFLINIQLKQDDNL